MRPLNCLLWFPEAQRPKKPIMATIDLDKVTTATSAATGPEVTLVFLDNGESLHIAMDYWTFHKTWSDPAYQPGKEH